MSNFGIWSPGDWQRQAALEDALIKLDRQGSSVLPSSESSFIGSMNSTEAAPIMSSPTIEMSAPATVPTQAPATTNQDSYVVGGVVHQGTYNPADWAPKVTGALRPHGLGVSPY